MRLIASLITLGLITSQLSADIPPPPPPKGTKYVSVENWVVLEKNVTGYEFFSYLYSRRLGSFCSALSLSDKPEKLPPGDSLIAVPEDTAKQYMNEAQLIDALEKGKIKGVQRLSFDNDDLLPDTDKRTSIPWKHTITAIDAENGITARRERDGKPFGFGDPQLSKLLTGGGRFMCSGFFASAALITLGLWLARRSRSL